MARGFHSTFLMAPGPGDLVADIVGGNLLRSSVCGQPRWLMPHHCSQATCRILGTILEVCSCESRLVCLDVHPSFAVAEDNELLFLFHPCFSKLHHALVHVLNGLVVDVQDAMMVVLGTRFKSKNRRADWVLRDVWLA